jgi:pyruvate formate lyase activating enzyme
MGTIFNLQEYAIQDGEGIRTTVFLKGCPLKCLWCSNPEGQMFYPELMHSTILCKKCGKCFSKCSNKALSYNSKGYPIFKRNICLSCQEKLCEKECPEKAIRIVGKYFSANALYEKVKTNSLFYRNSNGGITLSGGEPFAQPKFVKEFVEICEKMGLSVGVETCGLFNWNEVKEYIGKFDFYYFDIKCMDTKLHKQVTGYGNETILKNLELLSKIDSSKITVTVAVIPFINAFEKTITRIAKLCIGLGISKIRLLPYHSFGKDKYCELNRKYFMKNKLSISDSKLNKFKSIIKDKGIDCWIE